LSLRGMMRLPTSAFENRTHGAEKLGRVDTPTFSTESATCRLMHRSK
jgi:hypothetical protein